MPTTCPYPEWTFRNMIRFYGDALLAPQPTPKLEDHPLWAVHDCLLNIFATALHIRGLSTTRNLKTRHAMVTGTHLPRMFLLPLVITYVAVDGWRGLFSDCAQPALSVIFSAVHASPYLQRKTETDALGEIMFSVPNSARWTGLATKNCNRIISSTNFNAQFSLFINNMSVTLLSSTYFEHQHAHLQEKKWYSHSVWYFRSL